METGTVGAGDRQEVLESDRIRNRIGLAPLSI